ncbi:MAG: hypothetical protein LR015_03430 [Verrucomicrobia bacterium]|nr:hypothetical protein [Verrucomicrobiota bacterium]
MSDQSLQKIYRQIRKQDPRYELGAYVMMQQALDFTLRRRQKEDPASEHRHIDGPTLCLGVRDYMLAQYGPMAADLLRHWGIRSTSDFGEIVFHLADFGVFSVTSEDKPADFHEVFDFDSTFRKPYLPREHTVDSTY